MTPKKATSPKGRYHTTIKFPPSRGPKPADARPPYRVREGRDKKPSESPMVPGNTKQGGPPRSERTSLSRSTPEGVFFKSGAEDETRTRTGCPTRPSNVRVYHFHHPGTRDLEIIRSISSFVKSLFEKRKACCSLKFRSLPIKKDRRHPEASPTCFKGLNCRIPGVP